MARIAEAEIERLKAEVSLVQVVESCGVGGPLERLPPGERLRADPWG